MAPSSLFFCLQLFLLTLLGGCQPDSNRQSITFTGPVMGTTFRVSVIVGLEHDIEQLEAEIAEQLRKVDNSMSTYIDHSELNKLNRLDANSEFDLSAPLYAVLSEALEISEFTQGAFDITVAPAVRLWGFAEKGAVSKQPRDETLQALRKSVGYRNLHLNGHRLTKDYRETEINLSAIAKGFAVDQVARMLDAKNITDYLIEVGGELRARGKNSDQEIWRIAIEKPHALGGVQQIISLPDKAVATSGDYRNYLLIDGKKYSHTLDPKTLEPVFHKLALVSVIADNASTADALATALMVMGEQRAVSFAEARQIAAYFVIRGESEEGFEVKMTDKFAPFIQ